MGIFDGWKKRGRPRSSFTLEESKNIISQAMGEDPHIDIYWPTHRKIHSAVFSVDVSFLSFSVIESLLKHRHVRDIYFGPRRNDTGKFTIKLFYG